MNVPNITQSIPDCFSQSFQATVQWTKATWTELQEKLYNIALAIFEWFKTMCPCLSPKKERPRPIAAQEFVRTSKDIIIDLLSCCEISDQLRFRFHFPEKPSDEFYEQLIQKIKERYGFSFSSVLSKDDFLQVLKDEHDVLLIKLFFSLVKDVEGTIQERANIIRDRLSQNSETSLDLGGKELFFLPPEIGLLPELRILRVQDNRLEVIPEEICECEKLNNLIAKNNLIIALPEKIGELKKLTALNVSHNVLERLPASFGDLKSLERLFLSNNQIQEVPASIGSLSKLQELKLHFNPVKKIPSNISIPSLMYYTLGNNVIYPRPKNCYQLLYEWKRV